MNEQDKAAFDEWWTTANVRLTDIPKAQAVYIYESMLAHRDKQAAQAAPLVRLTEDEIDDLWDAHLDACEKLTGKRGYNAHKFYQEVMDAMERLNGGGNGEV